MIAKTNKFTWTNFSEHVGRTFESLHDNADFADVTLACEDNVKILTHKLVLAAASPMFMELFKLNQHPHPLIYMKGTKARSLVSIVAFIYNGEVNISQEDLDEFLSIGKELKIKGIYDNFSYIQNHSSTIEPSKDMEDIELKTENEVLVDEYNGLSVPREDVLLNEFFEPGIVSEEVNKVNNFVGVIKFTPRDTVIQREIKFPCTKCKRIFSKTQNLMKHQWVHNKVEDGKSLECKTCGKTFSDSYHWSKHRKSHNTVCQKTKTFYCKQCDKKFLSEGTLTAHNTSTHT